MSEHSPEPWKHVADLYEVVDAEGECVCGGKNHWDRAAPSTADGQRIVACVNACSRLKTSELEVFNAVEYGRVMSETIRKHVVAVRLGVQEDGDAEQIWKCVNACRGLNPEHVPGLVELCESILFTHDRDELTRADVEPLRELLAKVKG